MTFPDKCTIQTPSSRDKYHQKYLADPVEVSCQDSLKFGTNSDGSLSIVSGWLVVPPSTVVTPESIITINGVTAKIKPKEGSIELVKNFRRNTIIGKKIYLGDKSGDTK